MRDYDAADQSRDGKLSIMNSYLTIHNYLYSYNLCIQDTKYKYFSINEWLYFKPSS